MQSSSDLRSQAKNNFVSVGDDDCGRGIACWFTGVFNLLYGRFSLSSLFLLLLITLSPRMGAEQLKSMDASQAADVVLERAMQNSLAVGNEPGSEPGALFSGGAAKAGQPKPSPKLIVIGFLGGNVHATNLVHREAQLIGSLQQDYPRRIHAAIFANRDGDVALQSILHLLDEDKDGHLSDAEKNAARIVIFGHSWGASETVTLADRLNKMKIPVLLTIQVDSVQKQRQNDERIPPNVQEAVNFYQSEGLLRGRSLIVAEDPGKTKILGNHESSYRENSISCAGFPWYARAFMKRHIEIENDPVIWGKIEALILAKIM